MSASPALWTARAILAVALGIGVVWIATNHARTPAVVDPAYRAPAALAFAGSAPASPSPVRAGADFSVPAKTPASPAATVTPAPVPSPTPETYAIKRVLDTGGPIRYGSWFWDEAGVPAGKVIVTVDLKANILSIFRAGYEIGTAAIIYGADEKPTPLGVFPILQKDAHHVSNLYGAKMPYALRLTGDGVFIHSSKVAFDAATHGCVGIPDAFARKLFNAVKLRDEVIITRGGGSAA